MKLGNPNRDLSCNPNRDLSGGISGGLIITAVDPREQLIRLLKSRIQCGESHTIM